MQAIRTKYTAPGKIAARAARGRRTFTIPANLHSDQERHQWAARELGRYFAGQDAKQYGTPDAGANWAAPFVSGCLPDSTWAHVFTDTAPRSVVVQGRRWADSNGNTYHTAAAYVDGKQVATVPEGYGYGDSYEYNAADVMEKAGLMPGREHHDNGSNEAPFRYWDRRGVPYQRIAVDVPRRKDL